MSLQTQCLIYRVPVIADRVWQNKRDQVQIELEQLAANHQFSEKELNDLSRISFGQPNPQTKESFEIISPVTDFLDFVPKLDSKFQLGYTLIGLLRTRIQGPVGEPIPIMLKRS